MTNLPTRFADKYELVAQAGQGGMATVWRAVLVGPSGFRKPVAIKVMLPQLCADPHFVALFLEEARVSARISHPNVVQIHECSVDKQGLYFLVMEWVDGLDLLDYAQSFSRFGYFSPWAAMVTAAVEVAKGLSAAHEHLGDDGKPSPIFHRDVTPHNVLMGVNGAVKLTDFGLARAADRGTMTQPHVVKGKISYTAPEMCRGARASDRTDIFALGVTLYEVLSGRKLFDGASPLAVVEQIQAFNVARLDTLRRDLPPALVAAVHRAIDPDPSRRFSNAREMASTLARLLPRDSDMSRLGASVRDARERLKGGATFEDDELRELTASVEVNIGLSPSADPDSIPISVGPPTSDNERAKAGPSAAFRAPAGQQAARAPQPRPALSTLRSIDFDESNAPPRPANPIEVVEAPPSSRGDDHLSVLLDDEPVPASETGLSVSISFDDVVSGTPPPPKRQA